MKRAFIYLVILFVIPGVVLAQESKVDLGISISDGKLRSFYLAVSDYYGVSGKAVAFYLPGPVLHLQSSSVSG
jgi:hypothetical protein